MTSALDPHEKVDRYAVVWTRPNRSLVGFLDIERASGRHTPIPLFEVPMRARSAYYLPSPDSNSGDFTILGPVSGGTKVITIGVDL